jgi:hypothetical protein
MEFLTPYMNLIYLAAIVVALLLFGWIMIRTFGGKVRARRGARLGISEYYEVDKSRFLVLVRRDDVEHLVLVGGNQDVVIETNIRSDLGHAPMQETGRRILTAEDMEHFPDLPVAEPAPAPAAPKAPSAQSNVRPISPRPAPRPPVFGDAPEPRPAPAAPPLRAVERDPD